ncbi:MAG: hypothetical protein ACO3JL_11510 [Myxococcota bacterium]
MVTLSQRQELVSSAGALTRAATRPARRLSELDDAAISDLSRVVGHHWARAQGATGAAFLGLMVLPSVLTPSLAWVGVLLLPFLTVAAIIDTLALRAIQDEFRTLGYDKTTANAARKAWRRAQRVAFTRLSRRRKEEAYRAALVRLRDRYVVDARGDHRRS